MSADTHDPESPSADSTADKQQPERVIGRPFKPGQSGNPAGRKKGSRNLFAEDFLADFHNAWVAHGQNALLIMAAEKPAEFVNAAVKILPKVVEVHDPVGELDRAITAELLELVRRRVDEVREPTRSPSRVPESHHEASGLRPLQ